MRRRIVVAIALGCVLAWTAGLAARTLVPETVTVLRFAQDHELFGGWSGIDISADGRRFQAIGDSGVTIRGTLERIDGRLSSVQAGQTIRVRGQTTRKDLFKEEDSEGLSLLDDENHVISYEGFHRVTRHDGWKSNARRIEQAAWFADLPQNGSLEAVATLSDGTILTLPEMAGPRVAPYPVFRYTDEQWDRPYQLERSGSWRAVGADIGPDGWLYLLERQFLGFGFRSQIRRFDLSQDGNPIAGQLLYTSPPGRHGNLEGIGIWRDDAGTLRAVMVSDDNYLPFLRSQIVEVVLPN